MQSQDLATLLVCAQRDVIVPVFLSDNIGLEDKSKNPEQFDPVTRGDKDGQIFIEDTLYAQIPGICLIGEESNRTPQETQTIIQNSRHGTIAYIDPVDGTKRFAAMARGWSSMVAIVGPKIMTAAIVFPEFDAEIKTCVGFVAITGDALKGTVEKRIFDAEGELQEMTDLLPIARRQRQDAMLAEKPLMVYQHSQFHPDYLDAFTALKTHYAAAEISMVRGREVELVFGNSGYDTLHLLDRSLAGLRGVDSRAEKPLAACMMATSDPWDLMPPAIIARAAGLPVWTMRCDPFLADDGHPAYHDGGMMVAVHNVLGEPFRQAWLRQAGRAIGQDIPAQYKPN